MEEYIMTNGTVQLFFNLTDTHVQNFRHYLREEERALGTIENYMRNIIRFKAWVGDRPVTKELVVDYKDYLQTLPYAPNTINTILSSLNTFFIFAGWPQFRVKFVPIQRQMFRDADKDLVMEEYRLLVDTAYEMGLEREALAVETLAATGMRVSELKNTTVESIEAGIASVNNKGKVRDVLFPMALCDKLKEYARKNKIASGEIFLTKDGKSLSRNRIWSQMKRIAKVCGVAASKVFPHNLRHLFAVTFYGMTKNLDRLACVLGHTSVETTRRYLMEPVTSHREQLEQMGFVKVAGI